MIILHAVFGLSQPNMAASVRHETLCNLLESRGYDTAKFDQKTGFFKTIFVVLE